MEYNSYWYLGLGILSILLLIYVYKNSRSPRSLLLFIAMIGLGYMIETVIYNFRHSYLFFISLFAGIEWTFLKSNIYSHNWWRIGYTTFGLLVFFPLAKIFYQLLSRSLKGFVHSLLLFLIIGGSGIFGWAS